MTEFGAAEETAPASLDEWGGFPVKDFWRFAHERESIRMKRECLLPRDEWTDDPVLKDRFFTNTFREDDPGTRVALRIMQTNLDRDAERVWNLLLYRRFNRQDTWEDAIGYIAWGDLFEQEGRRMFERLQRREAERKPLFTDAHQVYPLVQLKDVDPKLLKRVIAASWRHDMPAATGLAESLRASADMKDAFKIVKAAKLPGIAGFLAWQLCLDMRYGANPILAHSDDVWAPVQAGCRVGLTLFANWPTKGIVGSDVGDGSLPKLDTIPIPECERLMREMRDGQDAEFAGRDLDFLEMSGGRPMTISSLEHTLCEAQKYWGIARGMPHSRRAYKG